MTANTIPKIYVLTIPESERHVDAKRQLDAMGVEYEFVYGRIWPEDEIPWEEVKGINRATLHTRYPQRCYGCREGHIRLLEKALADGCDSILSCEDDVWFEKIDLAHLTECHVRLGEMGGIINMCCPDILHLPFWGDSVQPGEHGTVRTMSWCMDTCYMLDRAGMMFYLLGLKEGCHESDVAMTLHCKGCKRHIPSYVRSKSPVPLNPTFDMKSNIQL